MTQDAITPWESAAVLVWVAPNFPLGTGPLDPTHVQTPPHPNPVPFWRFSDAVEHAAETLMNGRNHGKDPWIKAGEAMFGPLDVSVFYKEILARRGGR